MRKAPIVSIDVTVTLTMNMDEAVALRDDLAELPAGSATDATFKALKDAIATVPPELRGGA